MSSTGQWAAAIGSRVGVQVSADYGGDVQRLNHIFMAIITIS